MEAARDVCEDASRPDQDLRLMGETEMAMSAHPFAWSS